MTAAMMQNETNGTNSQADMSPIDDRKIFIGGLLYATTAEGLKDHFSQYGTVIEAVVIYDRNHGRSKGYGFVTFATAEGAARATEDPSPYIDGRKTNCNISQQRKHNKFNQRYHHGNAQFMRPYDEKVSHMMDEKMSQMYAANFAYQQFLYGQSFGYPIHPYQPMVPNMYLGHRVAPEEHELPQQHQHQYMTQFYPPMGVPFVPMNAPPGGGGPSSIATPDGMPIQQLVQEMSHVSLGQPMYNPYYLQYQQQVPQVPRNGHGKSTSEESSETLTEPLESNETLESDGTTCTAKEDQLESNEVSNLVVVTKGDISQESSNTSESNITESNIGTTS